MSRAAPTLLKINKANLSSLAPRSMPLYHCGRISRLIFWAV